MRDLQGDKDLAESLDVHTKAPLRAAAGDVLRCLGYFCVLHSLCCK